MSISYLKHSQHPLLVTPTQLKGVSNPLFIIFNNETFDVNNYQIHYNQQIYFYNAANRDLFEYYLINDQIITNKLISGKTWLDEKLKKNIYFRRKDFHGLNLRILVEQWEPFIMIEGSPIEIYENLPFNRVKTEDVSGVLFDAIESLRIWHNFTIEFVRPKILDWGSHPVNDSGVWTGVLGVIQNNLVDMIAVTYGVTRARGVVLEIIYFLDFELITTTRCNSRGK